MNRKIPAQRKLQRQRTPLRTPPKPVDTAQKTKTLQNYNASNYDVVIVSQRRQQQQQQLLGILFLFQQINVVDVKWL